MTTPRVPSVRTAGCLLLALLSLPLAAQETRLRDGRVLIGKITPRGDQHEIETRDGTVLIDKGDVLSTRDVDTLRAALAEKARSADGSTFAQLHLAMEARDSGLQRELWRHLDRALAALPDTDARVRGAIERRLGDFLAQLEPELLPRKFRQAPTATRVTQLLHRLRADTGPGETAAITELLVREAGADTHLRQAARREASPRHRIGALRALQRRELAGNDRFVLRTAVLDRQPEVRTAALELARPSTDAADVVYLATGLAHESSKLRVRTAQALAALGQPAAVELLVRAGPHAAAGLAGGGNSTRAHVAFLQQTAYIRDFDVEVASLAFIADPKVDALTTGSVLDVRTTAMFEVRSIVRSYREALQQLTSSDPGEDPRAWATWFAGLPTAAPTAAPTTQPR